MLYHVHRITLGLRFRGHSFCAIVYIPAGGLPQGIDQFDGDFFGVSEAELRSMDPHQHLGRITQAKSICSSSRQVESREEI